MDTLYDTFVYHVCVNMWGAVVTLIVLKVETE